LKLKIRKEEGKSRRNDKYVSSNPNYCPTKIDIREEKGGNVAHV
jgi:hypothetical protein